MRRTGHGQICSSSLIALWLRVLGPVQRSDLSPGPDCLSTTKRGVAQVLRTHTPGDCIVILHIPSVHVFLSLQLTGPVQSEEFRICWTGTASVACMFCISENIKSSLPQSGGCPRETNGTPILQTQIKLESRCLQLLTGLACDVGRVLSSVVGVMEQVLMASWSMSPRLPKIATSVARSRRLWLAGVKQRE